MKNCEVERVAQCYHHQKNMKKALKGMAFLHLKDHSLQACSIFSNLVLVFDRILCGDLILYLL